MEKTPPRAVKEIRPSLELRRLSLPQLFDSRSQRTLTATA